MSGFDVSYAGALFAGVLGFVTVSKPDMFDRRIDLTLDAGLTAIRGQDKVFVGDEEQRRKMLADLEQMETMIAATLAFARDDANEEPRKAFDLAVLLQDLCDAVTDAGAKAAYHGVPAVTYHGRPVALKRVFANLIDNAVKYGGAADVTLSVTDAGVAVTVDDDGPGIPEGQMEKVFAPFYRLEGSRSRDTGGVGLGLAAVRSIVRSQGGEVRLANRDAGGLRATIELPRA